MRRIKFLMTMAVAWLLFSQFVFAQGIDKRKSDIYSKLQCCACSVSFDKCGCPEAKEIKAYVEGLLEGDLSKEDIFYRIAKKFTIKVIVDNQVKAAVEKSLIAEAGKRRPQISLESASYDFGRVSKKQGSLKHIFKLNNQGAEKLVIKNIKTSCGCVVAALIVGKERSPDFGTQGAPSGWQATIGPGKTGELDIMIDLRHKSVKAGKLIREVYITSNDPIHPEVSVLLNAEVAF